MPTVELRRIRIPFSSGHYRDQEWLEALTRTARELRTSSVGPEQAGPLSLPHRTCMLSEGAGTFRSLPDQPLTHEVPPTWFRATRSGGLRVSWGAVRIFRRATPAATPPTRSASRGQYLRSNHAPMSQRSLDQPNERSEPLSPPEQAANGDDQLRYGSDP